MSPKDIVKELEAAGMQCTCDLDRWQPEPETGHSWVCGIHIAATEKELQTHIHDDTVQAKVFAILARAKQ